MFFAELEGKSERYAHAAPTGFSGPIEPFGRWVGCGPRHPPGSLPPWTTWHAFSCSPTASAAIQGAAAVKDSISYSGRRCSEPSWPPSLPLVPTHTGACHPSGGSLHLRAPQQGQTALPFQPGLVNAGDAICQRSAAPDAWGSGGSLASQTCPTEVAAAGV